MKEIVKSSLTLADGHIPGLEGEILTHNIGMKENKLKSLLGLSYNDFDKIYLTSNYQIVLEWKTLGKCQCMSLTNKMIMEELCPAARPMRIYYVCSNCIYLLEQEDWITLSKVWRCGT
jgi:hypothetical protein